MSFLLSLLVVLHLICWAVALGTWVAAARTRQPNPGMPHAVAGAVVTGLVLAALLPLCVVVASATLLWRRRKPWLPAIAAILLDVFLLFTALPGSSPLLLFAGYSLAVYRSTRAAWTAFGIGVAASAHRRVRPALNRLSVMTVEHRVAWSSEQNACRKHQALLKTFGRVRKVALSRIQPCGVSDQR